MSPLISPSELAAGIAAGTVLVVDCRKELSNPDGGQQAYREAHIPGAWYADLDHELSDLGKTGLGRHPLPDEAAFSKTLASWGWTPHSCVVAYDDQRGSVKAGPWTPPCRSPGRGRFQFILILRKWWISMPSAKDWRETRSACWTRVVQLDSAARSSPSMPWPGMCRVRATGRFPTISMHKGGSSLRTYWLRISSG